MSLTSDYEVLLRAAEIVSSRTATRALLVHHRQIGGAISRMLVEKKRAGAFRGNPFKPRGKRGGPTTVGSQRDADLAATRAMRDIPTEAYD